MSKELGRRLREARKAKGLTLREVGIAVSERGQNVTPQAVGNWERGENEPKAAHMQRLARILAVNFNDLLMMRSDTAEAMPLVHSYDPDVDERRGVSSTGKGRHRLTPGAIAEIESRAGMGGGGYAVTTEVSDDGAAASYAADFVKAEWIMPAAFVRSELGVAFGFTEIVMVDGDSMEPDFRSGDRVVVDRRKTGVKQGGVFAIRDGDELLVKQVELVRPETDPPRILVTSRNVAYKPYELTLDGSAEVIGRIAGRISRV